LFDLEDPLAFVVEGAFFDEVIDSRAGLEGWIELDEWVGPEVAAAEPVFHLLVDSLVEDVEEPVDVVRVVLY
jgi:hypothetical protein